MMAYDELKLFVPSNQIGGIKSEKKDKEVTVVE
jgi:hypothetical protein